MTSTTPTPVPSGMSIPVLEVQGHSPRLLQEFAGDVSFVVGLDPPLVVQGSGRLDGRTVRLHEKDPDHGKDVRVWEVSEDGGGRIVAMHAAHF